VGDEVFATKMDTRKNTVEQSRLYMMDVMGVGFNTRPGKPCEYAILSRSHISYLVSSISFWFNPFEVVRFFAFT